MCGVTLILVPTSWRGAAKPPPSRGRRARRARRAAPAAAPASAARGCAEPPPTLVCSGMFSPMLISAATLSVAMMCGVASTLESPLRRERVQHDAERRDAEMPVPSRFCVPGEIRARARRARSPASRSGRAGKPIDCAALKPPSKSVSSAPPTSSVRAAVEREAERRSSGRPDRSMITASMNTWRRGRSSLSMTQRSVRVVASDEVMTSEFVPLSAVTRTAPSNMPPAVPPRRGRPAPLWRAGALPGRGSASSVAASSSAIGVLQRQHVDLALAGCRTSRGASGARAAQVARLGGDDDQRVRALVGDRRARRPAPPRRARRCPAAAGAAARARRAR